MSDQRPARGSRAVRVVVLAVLALAVVYLLFTVVFPWVEQRMQDPTLGAQIPLAVVSAT